MTANEIAAKFYVQASEANTAPNGDIYWMLTKNQAAWLFRTHDADMRKLGDRIHQSNGRNVASGVAIIDGAKMAWSANEWKGGAARMIYSPIVGKTTVEIGKSDTLAILEAMQTAFLNVDEELDYSQISQDGKEMLKAQRKAIALEIRMNR